MCGIAFAFRAELETEALSRAMTQCLSRMVHRGPDGDGLTCRDGWAIGHQRLAVIDLAGSRQPVSDVSGRYWLSYNGELYNYQELRDRLRSQWVFKSRGDVEVVLAGMVLHGTDFLALMEGMWSLALWDSRAQDLVLVRDRMGQKPLYYQFDQERFACASELLPLTRLSWHGWQQDERSTADYLRYGYYLPGTTAYKDVKEVLPGHVLHWHPGRSAEQHPYWRLSVGGILSDHKQATELLKDAIVKGVQRRLVADVEVGALLSGGVDSSLIVAIIRQVSKTPLKTFTMGFSDVSFDERPYARRLARYVGSKHFEDCLDLSHSMDLIGSMINHVGQPFGDCSLLPTALVSELAARQVKVAVSGDGGDELFSGYQRYLARSMLRWYTRLPDLLKKSAVRMVTSFGEPADHHSNSLIKKAYLFIDAAQRVADETPYVAPLFYSLDSQRQLMPDIWQKGHQPSAMPEVTDPDDVHRMMAADALVYLPQDILTKVDRASMACSLEVRSPFLDRRVVELAFAMPRHWHRWGLSGKHMLRNAFGDLLPKWVWQRRKHGFAVPIHQWFRTGLQNSLLELLEDTHQPVNKSFVRDMIAAHLARRRDHGYRLWQLYVYLRWFAEKPWQLS